MKLEKFISKLSLGVLENILYNGMPSDFKTWMESFFHSLNFCLELPETLKRMLLVHVVLCCSSLKDQILIVQVGALEAPLLYMKWRPLKGHVPINSSDCVYRGLDTFIHCIWAKVKDSCLILVSDRLMGRISEFIPFLWPKLLQFFLLNYFSLFPSG